MNAQVTHAIQTQRVTIQLDYSCVHVILAILETALTAQVRELCRASFRYILDISNNPCHVNATCNNILGSFMCACVPGYSGDGFNYRGNAHK